MAKTFLDPESMLREPVSVWKENTSISTAWLSKLEEWVEINT